MTKEHFDILEQITQITQVACSIRVCLTLRIWMLQSRFFKSLKKLSEPNGVKLVHREDGIIEMMLYRGVKL